MKQKETLLYAVGAGFVGLWLFDVISSNIIGRRVLHHAAAAPVTVPRVAATKCDMATTQDYASTSVSINGVPFVAILDSGAPPAGSSMTAATAAAVKLSTLPSAGTVMAQGAGPQAVPNHTSPSFTAPVVVPGLPPVPIQIATDPIFVCDIISLNAFVNAGYSVSISPTSITFTPNGAATDPCTAVTTPCIFDATVGGCVRTGNSACTCSGCTMPSSSTSTPSCSKSDCIYDTTHKDCLCRGTTNKCSGCSKPTAPQPKCLQGDPACSTKPKPTPAKPPVTGTGSARVGAGATGSAGVTVTKPVKVCPPLVKC